MLRPWLSFHPGVEFQILRLCSDMFTTFFAIRVRELQWKLSCGCMVSGSAPRKSRCQVRKQVASNKIQGSPVSFPRKSIEFPAMVVLDLCLLLI